MDIWQIMIEWWSEYENEYKIKTIAYCMLESDAIRVQNEYKKVFESRERFDPEKIEFQINHIHISTKGPNLDPDYIEQHLRSMFY